jgi:hypothetical protein
MADLVVTKARQLVQIRRELRRPELRFRADRRAPVPWAHILTDVASEDMVADLLCQPAWNFVALFYRQIGNAAPRIERPSALALRHQSRCRAGLYASLACAATLRGSYLRRQRNGKQQLA